MPTGSPDTLLTFFAILKRLSDDGWVLQKVRVSADVQKALSEKFWEMEEGWKTEEVTKKSYSPTYHPTGDEVICLPSFPIPKHLKDATVAGQDTPTFTLPVPEGLSLRGVVGIQPKHPVEKSVLLFQACDQRNVLGKKFVLFEDKSVFRRLDGYGLTISDSLAAVIIEQELLFCSFFQTRKFLPLDHLYREASDEQVKQLFAHSKLRLADGVGLGDVLKHATPTIRRKVATVLDSGILDSAEVTADRIKAYAKKYGLELELKIKGGQRRIEIPNEKKKFCDFVRCLVEEFYTSELTQKRCETNSHRILDNVGSDLPPTGGDTT